MAGDQAPQAWIGREVEANILNAAGYDEYGFPSSLTAHYRVGILEDVSDLGIVASLSFDPEDEAEEPPVSMFYPWSSVVWLKPVDETWQQGGGRHLHSAGTGTHNSDGTAEC